MDYVELSPGWLENQIRATQREVRDWPDSFRERTADSGTDRESVSRQSVAGEASAQSRD